MQDNMDSTWWRQKVGTAVLAVFLCLSVFAGSISAEVRLLHSDNNGLDLEITTPLQFERTESGSRLRVEDWPYCTVPGAWEIPYQSVQIVLPPTGTAHAMVVARHDTSARVASVTRAEPDTPIGLQGEPPSAGNQQSGVVSEACVSIEPVGVLRDTRLARLVIRPVSYDGETVRWSDSLRVAVRFTDPPAQTSGRAARTGAIHPAALALNAGSIPAFTIPSVPAARTTRQASDVMRDRVRLFISTSGIYRITGEELIDLGNEVGADFTTIDPNTLRMETRGEEIPIFVDGGPEFTSETMIEFYAEPNIERFRDIAPDLYRDPYVDVGIYWLSWGGAEGARMVEEDGRDGLRDGEVIIPARYYWHRVHFEKDLIHRNFSWITSAFVDRNMWVPVYQTDPQEVRFSLDVPAVENTRPTYEFVGRANTAVHVGVTLQINGVDIGGLDPSDGIGGNELIHVQGEMPESMPLRSGSNTLELSTTDAMILNWFEVEYQRKYTAVNDIIRFVKPRHSGSGVHSFSISGFTTPDVSLYKLGVSRLRGYQVVPRVVVSEGSEEDTEATVSDYSLRFQDRIEGDSPVYIAVTDERKLSPAHMEYIPGWSRSLRDPTRHGDYLVISHPAFIDSLQRLVDHRRSAAGGSHDVSVVNVKQIYDEFDDGYPTADAVQAFVRYAYENWSTPKPQYILIVGDGILRVKLSDIIEDEYLVPSPTEISKYWGHAGADQHFGELDDNDILPDLFVGRISASNISELTTYVTKVIEFETSPDRTPWRNSALFVAAGDLSESVFASQSEAASRTVDSRYHQYKYYYGGIPEDAEVFGGSESVFYDYLNSGALWTTYLGHGAGEVWGYGQLLSAGDVEWMENRRRAGIYLSLTCFTGAFEEDFGAISLGESMLFDTGEAGAIAWIGATGLGWLNSDYYLLQSMIRTGVNAPDRFTTLGAALSAAKIDYVLRYGKSNAQPADLCHTMVYSYNLLGDPALQIRPPSASISMTTDIQTPRSNQSVTFSGQLDGSTNGAANIAFFDSRNHTLSNVTDIPVSNGRFTYSYTTPDDVYGGVVTARAYTHDETDDFVGLARIAIDQSLVDSLVVQVYRRDSIITYASVYDDDGIAAVECVMILNSIGDTDVIPMTSEDGIHYVATRPVDLSSLPERDSRVRLRPTIRVVDVDNDTTVYDNDQQVYPNRFPYLTLSSAQIEEGDDSPVAVVEIGNTGTLVTDSLYVRMWHVVQDGDPVLLDEVMTGPLSAVSDFANQDDAGFGARVARGTSSTSQTTSTGFIPQQAEVRLVLPDTLVDGRYPGADIRISVEEKAGSGVSSTRTDEIPPTHAFYKTESSDTLHARTTSGAKRISIPPGAFSESVMVSVTEVTDIPVKTGQPGITPVAGHVTSVNWPDSVSLATGKNPELLLTCNMTNTSIAEARESGRLRVGIWQESRRQWWLLPSERLTWNDASVRVALQASGIYALVISSDATPPSIQVIAQGQQFSSGGYVLPSLPFQLLLEDSNGVDTNTGAIRVWIDEEELPDTALVMPGVLDSPTSVPVTVQAPELLARQAGYTMRVQASDLTGNAGEENVVFRIAEEATLEFLGNFPNPFDADGTTLAFETSQAMQLVRVRIYDVSGRKVLEFDNFDMSQLSPTDPAEIHQRSSGTLNDSNSLPLIGPAYHEVQWGDDVNGVCDGQGNPLPNGVYFGIITVKKREPNYETIERVFKMVKLQ